MPKAKVRLAVGSSPGGKNIFATTEQSGGFTLRGLRANTAYTVIAEYQGEDGLMTGRADITAPSTNVSISLRPRDSGSGQNRAAIRPARPKVGPVSRPRPREEEEETGDADNAQLNIEDLDLPPAESASVRSGTTQRTARLSSDMSSPPVRAGWSVRQPPSRTDSASTAIGRGLDSDSEASSGVRRSEELAPELDDDGPNPLPPAVETERVSAASSGDGPDDSSIRVARGPSRSSSRGNRKQHSDSRDFEDPAGRMELDDRSNEQAPRPIPEEILPRVPNSAGKPNSYESTIVIGADSSDLATVRPTRPMRSTPVAPSAGSHSSGPAPVIDSAEAAEPDEPVAPSRRPTWRELSFSPDDVPVDESIHRAAGVSNTTIPDVITLASTAAPVKSSLPRLMNGTRPKFDSAASPSLCRIDPRDQRLVDFELPGLDGRMVSLRDIDADVILLDFWGSWCKQCTVSSAHMRELQAKWAGKRLQVVGIACEKGAVDRGSPR